MPSLLTRLRRLSNTFRKQPPVAAAASPTSIADFPAAPRRRQSFHDDHPRPPPVQDGVNDDEDPSGGSLDIYEQIMLDVNATTTTTRRKKTAASPIHSGIINDTAVAASPRQYPATILLAKKTAAQWEDDVDDDAVSALTKDTHTHGCRPLLDDEHRDTYGAVTVASSSSYYTAAIQTAASALPTTTTNPLLEERCDHDENHVKKRIAYNDVDDGKKSWSSAHQEEQGSSSSHRRHSTSTTPVYPLPQQQHRPRRWSLSSLRTSHRRTTPPKSATNSNRNNKNTAPAALSSPSSIIAENDSNDTSACTTIWHDAVEAATINGNAAASPPTTNSAPIPPVAAAASSSSNDTPSELIGARVELLAKKNKGKTGTVQGYVNKGIVRVVLEHPHDNVVVSARVTHVQRIHAPQEHQDNGDSTIPPRAPADVLSQTDDDDKHQPKVATVASNPGTSMTTTRASTTNRNKHPQTAASLVGVRVELLSLANKGKTGTVLRVMNKGVVEVELDNHHRHGVVGGQQPSGSIVRARTTHVQRLDGTVERGRNDATISTALVLPSVVRNDESHAVAACPAEEPEAGRQVRVIKGKHASKEIATIVGPGGRKDCVQVRIGNTNVTVKRTSLEFDLSRPVITKTRQTVLTFGGRGVTASTKRRSNQDGLLPKTGRNWAMPDADNGGTKISDRGVTKLVLQEDGDREEINLIDHLLKRRVFQIELPLNGRSDQKPLNRNIQWNDRKYTLLSVKLPQEENGPYNKKYAMNCIYAETEGPGVSPIDPWDELLRIADFSQLPIRKIVSRLELLESPAKFDVHFLEQSDFGFIPEAGNVGCGLIDEEFLERMMRDVGMGASHAKLVVAIQVRVFHPGMGIFKGVLVRSRNLRGAPIHIPPSMVKVPPSTHERPLPQVAVIICKNGVHPSSGSANEYIGRALDRTRKPPPEKSFTQSINKPLKDMIFRLFKTMGVSRSDYMQYKKESLHPRRRNHAWLVGVIDPTCSLPPDTIFVPGMKTVRRDTIFVTRAPCVKYEDGRILKHVTRKSDSMTDADWDWLNKLAFGVIIFSNPRPGKMSIPERISSGDLDGDLYFVCWDNQLIAEMKAAPLTDLDCKDDGQLTTVTSNSIWSQEAQTMMMDVGELNAVNQLVGKLYTQAGKIADASSICLRDADAIALFDAYNQALEYKKHGRSIVLPQPLHEKVPPKLRNMLTIPSNN